MASIKQKPLRAKDFYHKRVVIDASVLLKGFFNEDGREFVEDLFEMHIEQNLTILAPQLIYFELLNILSRDFRDANRVYEALKKVRCLGLGILEPIDKYTKEAIDNCCNNPKISYYDASYHALAKDMDATFITADKKYYDAMKPLGNIALLA